MKRMLLILILTFGLVWDWSIAYAEDGFYVIPVKKRNYAPVQRTGATRCFGSDGVEIACSGTGQDGEYQTGVAWPTPRFTNNNDGTVTDNLSGLIWLKDANCFGEISYDWNSAVNRSNNLASGVCGLSDGSSAGDWRLPNVKELQSLIHYGYYDLALPNTAGTGQWTSGDPFINVESNYYWSSTISEGNPQNAWRVSMSHGGVVTYYRVLNGSFVWPVRGGN